MAKYDSAAGIVASGRFQTTVADWFGLSPTGLRVDLPSDPGKMALVGTSSFSVSVISESVNRDFVSGYECGGWW
jgi:hypothetical protein